MALNGKQRVKLWIVLIDSFVKSYRIPCLKSNFLPVNTPKVEFKKSRLAEPRLTLFISIFLIHFRAWPWGSTISGHLERREINTTCIYSMKTIFIHFIQWTQPYPKCANPKPFNVLSLLHLVRKEVQTPQLLNHLIKKLVYWPVSAGNDNSILSRECVRGQPLNVPVPHCRGFGQKSRKTEPWCAQDFCALHLSRGQIQR